MGKEQRTENICFIGDAAASGVPMMPLLSRNCRDKASESAMQIEYVEIVQKPDFRDVFSDSILFDS